LEERQKNEGNGKVRMKNEPAQNCLFHAYDELAGEAGEYEA
jgi:hypothetical protein